MNKENIEELTFFILRGKNKYEIFSIIINNFPITQAQIFKKTNIYRTHIGRTVRNFENKKIIKCLNPKQFTYKLYEPTNLGLKIKENIEKYRRKKFRE